MFDSSGDVTLVVGKRHGVQQSIRIFISAMSLASPVWKATFRRVWVEQDASEISLPGDNVDAMLLVLRIAHLRLKGCAQPSPFAKPCSRLL